MSSSAQCPLYASPGDLSAEVAAAAPGQTVCLASGSYGTFAGAVKPGPAPVTVEPAPGASVDMTVAFNGASNITVTGVTLDGATLEGASHDVTLSYSTVAPSGQIAVFPDRMTATSNIVIDHDTLDNQSCTSFDLAGRIDVQDSGANNANPVGLTISNNTLSGGSADGVRIDAGSGIEVLNNTFTRFSDQDPCHSDMIQFYGAASHVIMKGNFFYDSANTASCSLGMWNGGDHNVFEDNVVAGLPNNGCYSAIDLDGDVSSTVVHNVFAYGGCLPNGLPDNACGEVSLADSGGTAGSGTLLRNNIMTDVSTTGGSTYDEDHNLCVHGCSGAGDEGPGIGDLRGSPVFAGGSAPSTFSGFALCAGSPGVGRASDGTNIGIELPTSDCAASPGAARKPTSRRAPSALVGVELSRRALRLGEPVTFEITLSRRARVTIKLLHFGVHRDSRPEGRYRLIAMRRFAGKTGVNTVRIGRTGGRRLAAGRYQAVIASGPKSRQVTFTVGIV